MFNEGSNTVFTDCTVLKQGQPVRHQGLLHRQFGQREPALLRLWSGDLLRRLDHDPVQSFQVLVLDPTGCIGNTEPNHKSNVMRQMQFPGGWEGATCELPGGSMLRAVVRY
jgi:hypothetical protein